MKTAYIKLFGQEGTLFTIKSNLDGVFTVSSDDKDIENYFSNIINNIIEENPVLSLKSGEREDGENGIIYKTIISKISRQDEKYLNALCEYLASNRIEYKGIRIRGIVK